MRTEVEDSIKYCVRCMYWEAVDEATDDESSADYDQTGVCRRFPPVFKPENDAQKMNVKMAALRPYSPREFSQPITRGIGDWCGEFKSIAGR